MPPKPSSGAGVFTGRTFCLSGAFSISQAEMRSLITNAGGTVVPSVNTRTDFLVCNQEGGSQYQTAEDKHKPVVTEDWVKASVAAAKLSTDPDLILLNADAIEADDDEDEDEQGEGKQKQPQQPQVFRGCVFVLDVEESEEHVQRYYVSRGARVVDAFGPSVTHVIAETFGSDVTKRAKQAGVPVVHLEWVSECCAEGKLLDPAEYPVPEAKKPLPKKKEKSKR